jgi:hypothetical protein
LGAGTGAVVLVAFLTGAEALDVTGAVVIAVTGAVAVVLVVVLVAVAIVLPAFLAGAVVVAVTGAVVVTKAVAVAVTGAGAFLAGAEALFVAVALALAGIGFYIGWLAIKKDEGSSEFLNRFRSSAIVFAAIGGTNFRGADLTNANFTGAKLKSTDLRKANLTHVCWDGAEMLEQVVSNETIIRSSHKNYSKPRPETGTFLTLKLQLQELADCGWTKNESSWYSQFSLNSRDMANTITPDLVIEILLNHARKVAPNFSVPRKIPRTVVEAAPFAAGQFKVDEEGWVTITISPDFFQDKLAAQAILAHEVCHYVLENSGIRKPNFELNERYTDLCMFVCGFGEIFLAGYKRSLLKNLLLSAVDQPQVNVVTLTGLVEPTISVKKMTLMLKMN